MRRAFPALAAIALAACNNGPTGEPSGPLRTDNEIAPENAEEAETAQDTDAGELPDPGPAPRFIGNWAEDSQSCQSAAWRFTDSMLHAPSGATCSFNRVTETESGYEIQATCTAKGDPAADTLKLDFAESAKAMMVKSESLGDAGLTYCGRDA